MSFLYKKSLFCILISVLCTLQFNSQIISSSTNVNKQKKTKKLNYKRDSSDIYLFLEYSPGISYRKLYSNETFLNTPLGNKKEEKPRITHSFALGIEHSISKNIFLKFAISIVNFGEKYSLSSNDSLIKYSNYYRYIGIPLNIGYKSKGKITFSFSCGFQALFLYQYLNKSEFEFNNIKENYKNKQDLNRKPTQLAVNADLKLAFPLVRNTKFYFDLGFTKQLTNSYNNQALYRHYSCLFNLRCGFLMPI